jgi:PST family polysaccharide transporter
MNQAVAIPERSGSRTVAAAMAKTGSAALLSALLAAAGTKILAASVGPAYVGLMGTLTQTRQTALVAATANGQAALVQGLNALEGRERNEYFRTALVIIAAATALVIAVLVAGSGRLARVSGLDLFTAAPRWVAWLAVPIFFGTLATICTGILNACGEIGRLARLQVVGPAVTAVLAAPAAMLVMRGNPGALTGLLAISAMVAAAVAIAMLRPQRVRIRGWICGAGKWWNAAAASRFLAIAGAMAATGFLAGAVLLTVRARIIRECGLDAAGHFDAAWSISMNHVTLVLASMQTYYLPELSRVRTDAARREHVSNVMKMAILACVPVIAGIALLKPVIIWALYSPKFLGAVSVLRWTLIGDYLKVTSWVLAIPMIAAADMRAFVVVDVLAQMVFLGCSWLFTGAAGAAQGAAIGFAACYAVNLMVCYWYLRRTIAWRFGPLRLLWIAGFLIVVVTNFAGGLFT